MVNITDGSRLIALLPEKTNEFYPLSNFYKEFANVKLTEQHFFRFDGFEETKYRFERNLEKYQTHLKFIYSTATSIRADTSLTFCRCLSSQNQKALDRNLRIIFFRYLSENNTEVFTTEKNKMKEKLEILYSLLTRQDNLNF